MLGPDEEVLTEFNWDDYCFYNTVTKESMPVVPPVSNSKRMDGDGCCGFYAINDACYSRSRIYEATMLGQFLREVPSADDLVETKLFDMEHIMKHCVDVGIATEAGYKAKNSVTEEAEEPKKEHGGFKIDDYRVFNLPTVRVSAGQLLQEQQNHDNKYCPELCTTYIRRGGPVAGAFRTYADTEKMFEVDLYKRKTARAWYDGERPLGHAMLLIGFGVSQNLKSHVKTSYYICQDNGGNPLECTARVPCKEFDRAYAPLYNGQKNLVEYEASGGLRNMVLKIRRSIDVAGFNLVCHWSVSFT